MKHLKAFISDNISLTRHLAWWTVLAVPVALITGSLVALFLWLLDMATTTRWQYVWLLFLLPVAGVLIHFLYRLYGQSAERGNNLIIDEIHEPGGGVPARMAPLVLVTTVITHLFGGSAGREGTAVQIGGSMAAALGRWLRLDKQYTGVLLMMGISGGFGAVFGTPVAGAVFALEVLVIGRVNYTALLPCLVSAILAHIVCLAWGIHHTQYAISHTNGLTSHVSFLHIDIVLLGKVAATGVAYGLCARLFATLSHALKKAANNYIRPAWLIPVTGGVVIIALTWLLGTRDYLGLGVVAEHGAGASIVNAFQPGGVPNWAWMWKLVFTVITLSMGFKGGEVTPLFFIGAALGCTLATLTGAPADLLAALGFIAVFAGAANTPVACTLMGVELFGGEYVLYYAVACFMAYYFSGPTGIYTAQRRPSAKF